MGWKASVNCKEWLRKWRQVQLFNFTAPLTTWPLNQHWEPATHWVPILHSKCGHGYPESLIPYSCLLESRDTGYRVTYVKSFDLVYLISRRNRWIRFEGIGYPDWCMWVMGHGSRVFFFSLLGMKFVVRGWYGIPWWFSSAWLYFTKYCRSYLHPWLFSSSAYQHGVWGL